LYIWAAFLGFLRFIFVIAIPGVAEWLAYYLTNDLLRVSGWVLLGVFLPALIWIAVHLKQTRSGMRLDTLVRTYDLASDRYYEIYRNFGRHAFSTSHYFPVLIITALCFFFATLIIFTDKVIVAEVPQFFTTGHYYKLESDSRPPSRFSEHDVSTLLVISYAYLGWYIWSVSTVFSRLVTMEFVPGTLYAIMSRLVLSIITAAVIYQMIALLPEALQGEKNVEALGFLAGIFPSTLLNYVKAGLKKTIQASTESEEMSLDMIQGISPWRMFRLYDTGLDDCENLAAANPIELWDVTNLSLLEIIDWVGQAQLAVLMRPELFATLRKNGIRTSIDFHQTGADPNFAPLLVSLTGYDQTHLTALLARMQEDPNFIRLKELRSKIK
jgi:hypothetical protein